MLYKTGPNKARFHFYSDKPWLERKSREFDLPSHNWVTIQVAFSRYSGYEIMIFDYYGREMFSEKAKVDHGEQDPDKVLHLFQNFTGYADHFVLFKERKTLPLKLPEEGYDKKGDDAIISLKFNNYTEIFKVIKVCQEPLEVPEGFTDEEYYEYYTRQRGTYSPLSEYNATCPGTDKVEVKYADLLLNLVQPPEKVRAFP